MTRIGAVVAALALLLSACTGADPLTDAETGAETGAEPTASASGPPTGPDSPGGTKGPGPDAATSTPYLPVPETVALTMQGADLGLGDTATVAWEPRRGVVGALDIKVTRLEQARLEALAAFRLDRVERRSSLYYVRGTVRNVGDTDLAGVDIPLYVVDARNTLIQATPFAAAYKPCPSSPLPKPFRTGRRLSFCLVYLLPERGSLEAVSFRPTQEYDPITWDGKVVQARAARQRPAG